MSGMGFRQAHLGGVQKVLEGDQKKNKLDEHAQSYRRNPCEPGVLKQAQSRNAKTHKGHSQHPHLIPLDKVLSMPPW